MTLKSAIIQGFRTLANPEREFENINKRSLEKILEDYIKLLLASGLLAAVIAFIFILINSTYLNLFRGINIDYWRLINYSAGISGSLFFFYLFAGTFLFFLLSLIIRIFVRRIKYTRLISVLCYSLSPILLIGWISNKLILALGIWSAFLLIVGIRQTLKEEGKISDKSSSKIRGKSSGKGKSSRKRIKR
ncbi:YIP1 family protein [Candidatus Woesearchaeota archaeon]|nr:YIP1 family protein [Candidatus Woesearchaeota archaeon]